MKTITEQWEDYKRACYPAGIPPSQTQECFGGAFSFMVTMEAVSFLPEEQAFAKIEEYKAEIMATMTKHMGIITGRN